jgi:hypothetical protein
VPHTAKYRPWRQHVVVEFSTEVAAVAFERYLKSGSGRAFAERHFVLAASLQAEDVLADSYPESATNR